MGTLFKAKFCLLKFDNYKTLEIISKNSHYSKYIINYRCHERRTYKIMYDDNMYIWMFDLSYQGVSKHEIKITYWIDLLFWFKDMLFFVIYTKDLCYQNLSYIYKSILMDKVLNLHKILDSHYFDQFCKLCILSNLADILFWSMG